MTDGMDETDKDPALQIALIQMTASKSLEDNLGFLSAHIADAANAGALYIQSPENSLIMDLDASRVADVAGSAAYGAALDHLSNLAASLNVWLHIGATPFLEKAAFEKATLETSGSENGSADRAALTNRSLLFNPAGDLVSHYDKIHMFDVRLPGGEHYQESKNYHPGERAVVVDCGFARLGLSICYDLRFAALYRQLAQAGAEMISVPAAFTRFTGAAHWHVLLRARAIETGCFVVAAAQGGAHETGRETYGHSLVVSPWGEVLLDGGEEPGVHMVTINPGDVAAARAKVPSLTHDRAFDLDAPL